MEECFKRIASHIAFGVEMTADLWRIEILMARR
jgi:hypothetical protein